MKQRKNKPKKKKWLLFFKSLGIVIVLVGVVLFVYRNQILSKAIAKIDQKMVEKYQCHFTVKDASFTNISDIQFSKIALVPQKADTLLAIQELHTSVNLAQLLFGNIQLGKLTIKKGFIQLVKTKHGSNFEAFLLNKNNENISDDQVDYAKLANKIIANTFNLVPTEMNVTQFQFRLFDLDNKVYFNFKKLALSNRRLTSQIEVKAVNYIQNWSVSGIADPRNRNADVTFLNPEGNDIQLPYFQDKINLNSSFKSIHLCLKNIEKSGDELYINGFAAIEHLNVTHPKIASKEVSIDKAQLEYHLVFGPRFVAMDSTSTIQLNAITCHPFFKYNNEKEPIFDFQLTIPTTNAQDFISSLPQGLFSHFEGMQAQGAFKYQLLFNFNKNHPEALIFESKLTPDHLRITKYGEADLTKINSEFQYRAIEKGVLQRPILVGSANQNFTPLAAISPYLQKCVLTSEDPSFFNHRGFINEAFKQSIAKNIKTKKFARGASTISMQLVKNVFLTREKTISRKLEEILLVYLMENNRTSSKERMFEVYLNIIEWGPNVYGIGEASAFYFHKKPIDLTLNESLFLATIIPRPTGFNYRFSADGSLKPFARQQHRFLTQLMLRRSLLTPTDTIGQNSPLVLNGLARLLLKNKQTVLDSTAVEEDGF